MIEMIIIAVVVGVIVLGLYLMSKKKEDTGCIELNGYEIYGWDYVKTDEGKEPTQMILKKWMHYKWQLMKKLKRHLKK